MEREIKFRAMTIPSNPKWVYGHYRYGVEYPDSHATHTIDGHIIDETTLGQFTGLKDKNGTEIYEGDIIKLVDDSGNEILVVCEYGIARRANHRNDLIDIPSFYFKKSDGTKSFPMVNNYLGKHDLELFEVIGNIYTHPQLLEHAH